MKVIVAGATGFLGRRLCRELVANQHEVGALVRPGSDHTSLPKNVHLAVVPTWSPRAVGQAIGAADVLVDLVGVQGGEDTPATVLREGNYDATATLVSGATGRVARFVLVSSVRVYGVGHREPIPEDTPLRPNTEYGRAKALAEDLVNKVLGRRSVILRLSEVYGPGDQRSMIYRLLKLVKQGVRFWAGSGNNLIHPCYVDDAINGLVLGVIRGDATGPYNIAGGEAASMRSVVQLAAKALGTPPPRWFIPTSVVRLGAQTGRLLRWCGLPFPVTVSQVHTLCDHRSYDLSRSRERLCYEPRVCLADGLQRTLSTTAS